MIIIYHNLINDIGYSYCIFSYQNILIYKLINNKKTEVKDQNRNNLIKTKEIKYNLTTKFQTGIIVWTRKNYNGGSCWCQLKRLHKI